MNETKRTDGTVTSSGIRASDESPAKHARRARTWRKINEYIEAAQNQEIGWQEALDHIETTVIEEVSRPLGEG